MPRFESDGLGGPDIRFGHRPGTLAKCDSIRVRRRNGIVCFASNVIGTDTVVVLVIGSGRELERIEGQSMYRVPCVVC